MKGIFSQCRLLVGSRRFTISNVKLAPFQADKTRRWSGITTRRSVELRTNIDCFDKQDIADALGGAPEFKEFRPHGMSNQEWERDLRFYLREMRRLEDKQNTLTKRTLLVLAVLGAVSVTVIAIDRFSASRKRADSDFGRGGFGR